MIVFYETPESKKGKALPMHGRLQSNPEDVMTNLSEY